MGKNKPVDFNLQKGAAFKIEDTTFAEWDSANNRVKLTGDIQAAAGSIGTVELADGAVTPVKIGTTTASNVVTGAVKSVYLPSSVVKPLLDTNTNDLWEAPAGAVVLDVMIFLNVAAGTVGTVDIGVDDQWANVTADPNAFITAFDLNGTPGTSERMTTVDAGSAAAFANGLITAGGGSVTIDSSADLTASAVNAAAIILYIESA